MKILVPTPVSPNLRSLRIDYVNSIKEELIKKTNVEIFWFVYRTLKTNIKTTNDTKILEIASFQNAVELLKYSKPDLILVNWTLEPIHYSLSIAAKFLKIPIVSFYLLDYDDEFNMYNSQKFFYRLFKEFKRLLRISLMPTNIGEHQKNFFPRVIFYLYKKNFLKKTIKSIGKDNMKILHAGYPHNDKLNTLADLCVLTNASWIEPLKRIGISENKIVVTGNPIDDFLFKLTKQDSKRKNKSKTSILIVTDSLYEHGHWSKNERDLVLTSLLQTLDSHPEISFALKIHPSSEHILYYQSLIETLQINTHIYQQEILFDLIRDFDIILTYGYSTAHTQITSAEKKMILYDVNLPFCRMKLIDAGINSGFVKVCSNIKDLIKIIDELQKHNVLIDEEFIKARNDLTFQFDGKSSERICNELLNLLEK